MRPGHRRHFSVRRLIGALAVLAVGLGLVKAGATPAGSWDLAYLYVVPADCNRDAMRAHARDLVSAATIRAALSHPFLKQLSMATSVRLGNTRDPAAWLRRRATSGTGPPASGTLYVSVELEGGSATDAHHLAAAIADTYTQSQGPGHIEPRRLYKSKGAEMPPRLDRPWKVAAAATLAFAVAFAVLLLPPRGRGASGGSRGGGNTAPTPAAGAGTPAP